MVEAEPDESESATITPRRHELVAAVILGLVVGTGIFYATNRGGDDETVRPIVAETDSTAVAPPEVPTTEPSQPTTTEPAATDPGATVAPLPPIDLGPTIAATDAAPLLDAYQRSLEATFALDAVLTRVRNGTVTVTDVRQAHRSPRRLDEVGVVSVVIDGDTLRQCDRSSGVVLCTDPEPAASNEQRFEQFTALVGGTASLYDVFTPDLAALGELAVAPPGSTGVTCWSIVARVVAQGLNFGDEAAFCFDDGTGALVSRYVRSGETEERFRTVSLRADVDDGDLDPSRS
jgi:hypothetical protein